MLCPIRIHHTHRLSHVDFDLFSFFFLSALLPLSLMIPFSPLHHRDLFFCLILRPSVLHSYLYSWVLPLRQQADRFWMSHRVRLISSAPSVSSSLWQCSSITSLSLKGQRRAWHLTTWTLPLLLSLPSCIHDPRLRQSDIYRGTGCLLRSSCLAKEHWRARWTGEGKSKRVQKFENGNTQLQRRMTWSSGGEEIGFKQVEEQ